MLIGIAISRRIGLSLQAFYPGKYQQQYKQSFHYIKIEICVDVNVNRSVSYLIQGLSKSNFFKPSFISGQLINNFHNKPLR